MDEVKRIKCRNNSDAVWVSRVFTHFLEGVSYVEERFYIS